MPTLDWIGKKAVVNHHREVPFHILKENESLSFGKKQSGNLIVEGDNLVTLKALFPYYRGKVKCIYIDPPYNTGNEGWVYNDNVNSPEIKKWLGKVVGKEMEDLSRHDKWLCMMYPRLQLLKDFLTEDGIIAISIGYHELNNLVCLCNEIFSNKQISTVTVQTSGGKPSAGFTYLQEYIILVAPREFSPNPLDFCGGISRTPFEGLTLSTFTKEQRPGQAYPIFVEQETGNLVGVGESLADLIKSKKYLGEKKDFKYDYSIAPEGTVAIWPITTKGKDCVWRQISTRLKNDWEKGYIKISKNKSKTHLNKFSIQYLPEGVIEKIESGQLKKLGTEDGKPTLILGENLTEGSGIPTIWTEKEFFTVNGTRALKEIFPEREKVFDYPKAPMLISSILKAITNKDDYILDSFAGSGTTAQAVLELNKEDKGNRKFILCEMLPQVAESITRERAKRVIERDGLKEQTGFKFAKLGEPMHTADGDINPNIKYADLARHVFFMATGTPLAYNNTEFKTPLIGVSNGVAIYLLYNGILGDNSVNGGNRLTQKVLKNLPKHDGVKIIYGTACGLSEMMLRKNNIVFRQIPYSIFDK